MYTIKESTSSRGYFHEKNNRQVEITPYMNDEDFSQLVALEVKKRAHPDGVKFLNQPENLERWHRALQALAGSLNYQIEGIENQLADVVDRFSNLGAEGEYRIAESTRNLEERKRKISGFRFHVEKRVDDVAKLILAKNGTLSSDGSVVEFFRKAIQRHKQLMHEYEFEPTVLDEALWETLKGKWVFEDAEQRLDDEDDRSLDGTQIRH
jgi:hypothetical protein